MATPTEAWELYVPTLLAWRPLQKKDAKKLAKLASPAALPKKFIQPVI